MLEFPPLFENPVKQGGNYRGGTKGTPLMGFQIYFSSYLAQFFELYLHIWYLGSYLNILSGKIKVFMIKYFFVSRVRFWSKIWVILVDISALEHHIILTKIRHPHF